MHKHTLLASFLGTLALTLLTIFSSYALYNADSFITLHQTNLQENNKTEKQYKKFFERGTRQADVITIKSNQLESPLNVKDSAECIAQEDFQSFMQRAPSPKTAFENWIEECGVSQAFDAIASAKEQETQKNAEVEATKEREQGKAAEAEIEIQPYEENLHNSYSQNNDIVIPESVIAEIINSNNWDASTQTLLGNQQGITHSLAGQQSEDLKNWGINELIGVGLSSYSGSDWSRITNVRNAASKLNGKILHPGESVSMVESLAPFSSYNGYVIGIIISKGEFVKAMGGGVCQTVTTMFRAWQNSGLEVTKFKPHSRNISYYGKIGFDATMFKAGRGGTSIDLLLKNNTNHSVMIKIVDRNPYQMVLLYGTKDRKVLLDRYKFSQYSYSQTAKWKRMIEYNNSGEWVENYFNQTQSY